MVRTFVEDKALGLSGERLLDGFFQKHYLVFPATRQQQWLDIDRIFIKKNDLLWTNRLLIEYKTDFNGHSSGNAFIEIWSNEATRRPGWAYSSQADILIYFLIESRVFYWIGFDEIKKHLARWEQAYPTGGRKNPEGYWGVGRKVPLWELEAIARRVIAI